MRAMVLEQQAPIEEGPLEAREVGRPEPGSGRIRVEVSACGLCHTDLHTVEGDLELHKQPVIPGHQIVGRVDALGEGTRRFEIGDRVGMAWLHEACGECQYCEMGMENLCEYARFTGWDVDGGYAEYTTVGEDWAYLIPEGIGDVEATPLLCGGIIGYRAFRLSGATSGMRVGLYGFGNSAHMTIQVARHEGCEVYVFTRSEEHKRHAEELGAAWVGEAGDEVPEKMNASIMFAPAGKLIPLAMEALDKGGTLALAGIWMSPVPELRYEEHLYHEKVLRSVANSTRRDGEELLELATEVPIETTTATFPMEEANDALLGVKESRFTGDAVLVP
ncbi:MAG: zinc-dependent alcohol dehydrogenase family protein [bacterium]